MTGSLKPFTREELAEEEARLHMLFSNYPGEAERSLRMLLTVREMERKYEAVRTLVRRTRWLCSEADKLAHECEATLTAIDFPNLPSERR